MSIELLQTYLSNLVGQPLDSDSLIKLTSGQRARLVSWADAKGIPINRTVIRNAEFPLASALEPDHAPPPPSTPHHGYLSPKTVSAIGPSVGIDMQLVCELLPVSADPKSDEEFTGIFSMREISYAQTRADVRETLTGLFAAKEAIRKADASYASVPLPDIEILPDSSGRPLFPGFALSISHSGQYAIACALRSGSCASAPESLAGQESASSSPALASAMPERMDATGNATRNPSHAKLALIVLLAIGLGALLPILYGIIGSS